MNNKQLILQINNQEPTFLKQARKKVNKHNSYICPLCENGSGKTGDGIAIMPDTKKYTCFKCHHAGSVFDWWLFFKGLTDTKNVPTDIYSKELKACAEFFRIDTSNLETIEKAPAEFKKLNNPPKEKEQLQQEKETYTISDELKPEHINYLNSRNITDTSLLEIAGIKAYANCFSYKGICKENISGGYTVRALTDNIEVPKKNIGHTDLSLFQYENFDCKLVFITEGLFDSLTLFQMGINSICLNSVNNFNKLYEYLHKKYVDTVKQNIEPATYILLLDNDSAGINTTQDILQKTANLKLDIRKAENIFNGTPYNDINEFYVKDKETCFKKIQILVTDIYNDIRTNMPGTFQYWWNNKKRNEQKIKSVKYATGLNSFDRILGGGLPIGLTVLGALSGLGKTTLLTQISEHLANQKINVLYFSIGEQLQGDLFEKGLIRNLFFTNNLGKDRFLFDNVENYSKKINNCYTVYDSDINSVLDIDKKIQYIKTYFNDKIVVFVDYLQKLKATDENGSIRYNLNDKQKTDQVMQGLKDLSSKYLIPIVAVSSLNRENYFAKIDFPSFKESGIIEFTADLIVGLDLFSVRHNEGTKEQLQQANKSNIDNELKQDKRKVSLYTVKNRFAKPKQTADLLFHAKYGAFYDLDYTEPDEIEE